MRSGSEARQRAQEDVAVKPHSARLIPMIRAEPSPLQQTSAIPPPTVSLPSPARPPALTEEE